MGQLVLSIEHKGDNMKCLIPYGGSNPGEDDTLPDNFALRTIEVDGDTLQHPQYKGSGTLKVEKGYDLCTRHVMLYYQGILWSFVT